MVTGGRRTPFGSLPGGEQVELLSIGNEGTIRAGILTYGASIQSLLVPDRGGRPADVVLGHSSLAPYLNLPQYFGATVGRVANRIAGGCFTLDGRDYRVPANDGPNALHGGSLGFDKRNWSVSALDETSVVLTLVSPDGDQGFPGAISIEAAYRAGADSLCVDYSARCEATTLINLSNHAYWNLAGEGAPVGAMHHLLTIPADFFLPTDRGSIPTGEFRPVDDTPFDFREPRPIGARVRDATDEQIRIGRGYDHNWIVAREPSADRRLLARLEEPLSGRAMEILSNQPGLQFYSGNFLDGKTAGKAGALYRMGDAVCLEPQMFPDTPNRPEFGSIRLEPGETYRNRIEWRFTAS